MPVYSYRGKLIRTPTGGIAGDPNCCCLQEGCPPCIVFEVDSTTCCLSIGLVWTLQSEDIGECIYTIRESGNDSRYGTLVLTKDPFSGGTWRMEWKRFFPQVDHMIAEGIYDDSFHFIVDTLDTNQPDGCEFGAPLAYVPFPECPASYQVGLCTGFGNTIPALQTPFPAFGGFVVWPSHYDVPSMITGANNPNGVGENCDCMKEFTGLGLAEDISTAGNQYLGDWQLSYSTQPGFGCFDGWMRVGLYFECLPGFGFVANYVNEFYTGEREQNLWCRQTVFDCAGGHYEDRQVLADEVSAALAQPLSFSTPSQYCVCEIEQGHHAGQPCDIWCSPTTVQGCQEQCHMCNLCDGHSITMVPVFNPP